jgi:lipoprotein-anchoring transpeptidase ErfK/SrfK
MSSCSPMERAVAARWCRRLAEASPAVQTCKKWQTSRIQVEILLRMIKSRLRALLLGAASGMVLLSGCTTTETTSSTGTFPGNYTAVAYKPKDSSAVRVKVSLENAMVYVMEGDRPLLVTPCTIGVPGKSTPTGSYHVTGKEKDKRSASYGFWVRGGEVIAGEAGRAPGAGYHYVGYPMPYWVEFKPEYGFHAGAVWPVPHSHGCIRLHPNVAPKFFALVHDGTAITISRSLPEDATIGKNVARPTDYTWRDPVASLLTTGPSSHSFPEPQGPILVSQ